MRVPTHSECFRVPQVSHVEDTQRCLQQLRWMLQKDAMGQDLFLIGPPGPMRRWLALKYCNLVNKEVEFLTISSDTTEADIKARREIHAGTVEWIHQPAVKAALLGRILIIDGIEKAERNVLPILNNLLENREMALDDGRFLMHPSRYDELLAEHGVEEMDRLGFLRVSPDFRVIALGLPVPPFPGTPLDPPLRSRFQCMAVDSVATEELMHRVRQGGNAQDAGRLKQLAAFVEALQEVDKGMSDQDSERMFLDFGASEALKCAKVLGLFPELSLGQALAMVYPLELYSQEDSRKGRVFAEVLEQFGFHVLGRVWGALQAGGPTAVSQKGQSRQAPNLCGP